MSNQKQDQDQKQKKDFQFVYFIENHIMTEPAIIVLARNYNEVEELEVVEEKEYGPNSKYKYRIYRLKILTLKIDKKAKYNNLEIKIKLENKDGKAFENKIEISDFERDIFIYDFKFDKIKESFKEIEPPKSINFDHIQQFDIYIDYLRKKLKALQSSKENEDFIFSTQKLLIGKEKKYLFSFYIKIFLECFSTKYIQRFLLIFKPEKIENVGNLPEDKIKLIANILKIFEKNPNKVLDNINDQKKKNDYGKNLFAVILFFNYNFNKDRMKELLNNEVNKSFIYKALLDYNNLFKELSLTKEQFNNLFQESLNFEHLLKVLKFSNSILGLIETIYEKFEIICDFCKSEISINKKKPIIDIETLIVPQRNDNIKEIFEKYKSLYDKQKESLKYIFLVFNPTLCEKYISYFEGTDINNLFYIRKLIDFMKEKNKKFEIAGKDINKIIHETGLALSKAGKLSNIEILNFISKDIYYNDSINYGKKIFRPLEILNGFNIKTFDDEFYLEWKKLNWNKIFDDQYFGGFLSKVANLIDNLDNFHILFKLFDMSDNPHQPDYNHYSLITMQKKFIELINNFETKNEDDLIKLLFYSDQRKANIEEFLTSNLHKKFTVEKINDIYIKFVSTYKDIITPNTKFIITEFFTKNPTNSNPKSILNFIKSCPELSSNILQNIDKFIIEKEDFFTLNENDKLNLFKGLLDEKYLKKEEYKNTYYVQSASSVIDELKNDIKKGEILYKNISIFYNEKNNQKENNKLYDRLKMIALNNNEDYENYKDILDKYYSSINNILDELQFINEDFLDFYYNTKKDIIDQLKKIIDEIKNGKLNVYDKWLKEANNYITEYKSKAQARAIKKKNLFFQTIFNNYKGIYKTDDNQIIKKTEDKFKKIKIIFNKDGIKDLNKDKDILKSCMNAIRNKKEGEINDAIASLIEIFGNEINNANYDKKEIVKSMILLSKKEDIYNVSVAISIFLENLKVIKGDLWNLVKKIMSDLENNDDEKIIKDSINSLKDENIDIEILNNTNLKDNYLNILLLFKEQPKAIEFIIKNSREDCRKFQEFAGDMDNGFVNINDILDLEKCVEFRMKLGDEESFKKIKDKDIIELFKREVENEDNKGIEFYFTNYINNYAELKSLSDSGLDKSLASKQKIEFLCKNSIFYIKNQKGKFFKGKYFEESEDKENKENKVLKEKKIKMYTLLELRDRAQLTKKVKREGDEEESKILDNYKKFVERVSEINNIYDLVEDLYYAGYPEIIEIEITIKDYESNFKGCGLNTKDYNKFTLNLMSLLSELRKSQLVGYKDKQLLRFIYGRQFNLIINALKGKEKKKIYPFLKFFTNNLIKKEDINYEYINKNRIYEDMIDNCVNYLDKVLKENELTLEKIYEKSKIIEKNKDEKRKDEKNKDEKNKDEYKGVYLHISEKLEKNLFQIYKYLTKNTPIAQNILLCNKETTIEELTAFLYRSILCPFNSCFIIGGVELLELDKKSKLIELLNKLFVEAYNNMKSCLIILYTDRTTDIFKSLELVKYKKILTFNKENDISNLKIDNSNVEIISSDHSGVGKSTQIKLAIEQEKKKYIYFPLGGVFNRKDIIRRLKNLEISNNCAIHLDLYDTDEIDLMMEFLFSILITKVYGQNEDIFYLPKDIEIKIEIPNGFIRFMEKFPILTLFPSQKLKLENLAPLIVSNDISSNVQVVANYLKALKDNILDTKDLYFESISDNSIKNANTTIICKALKQEDCQKLIFEEIKETIKSKPNYYQISTFIDVLAVQFKKLNRNFFFRVDILQENPKIAQKEIKKFIVKSFIKITNHFTEGIFTDIVKSQELTYNLRFNKYDEEKDIKDAVEKLSNAKHREISFKEIDPSLIFFHEGSRDSFSIITNKKETDQEYIDLCDLWNFNNPYKREDLPHYNDDKIFTNKKFLKELIDILDIKNPLLKNDARIQNKDNNPKVLNEKENEQNDIEEEEMEEEEEENEEEGEEKEKVEMENEEEEINEEEIKKEGEKEEQQKSVEEIAENYVITADNFIKMILILLRIRANIPVIMMGETGCGKTSLIRKLSELLNNGSSEKMKILNIHAGISDKDIIKFLKKNVINEAKEINKKNKKEKKKFDKNDQVFVPKKLWVFLDEINTCKSMGLISELMCKHTYQGKRLPPNIVFIAACNPYRQGTMKKDGLNVELAQKELNYLNKNERNKVERASNSSLVYTVNPLPHSLLNFVFNFGSLEKEDEEKYIVKMINDPILNIYSKCKKNEENNINITEEEKEINKKDIDFKSLHNLAKDLIVKAQNFIREKNGIASVSLREIRRFNIFFEFFFDYLKKKKKTNFDLLENKQLDREEYLFYQDLNENDLQAYSIIVSVFVCYYLRITDNKTRNLLAGELTKKIQEYNRINNKSLKEFTYLPKQEELFIIKNIELEKGIAKNRALLDNIFSLFIAINNKVPIFIVGKPGCSKSLSVQLINKAMKGSSSNNLLFKRFPKILLNSYQGSMGSTSQGVKKVFNKARKAMKKLKGEEKKKNISMIFFDEMGLAEHSPNNPLKVIHSELEYDLNTGDKKVAFVGISNWVLDASKMNRGMYLSIPDPEEEDIKITSYTIGESYDETLALENKTLYENLGMSYFKYKNYLKKEHNKDGKEDFHGNRDFYHLIKNVARNILNIGTKQIDKHILDNISIKSIERNFGGLQFDDISKTTSLDKFKNIFIQYYQNIVMDNKYEVLERIKDNLNDLKSRYLLIISKPSVGISLLQSILSDLNKEYSYYIGSQFQYDLQSEEYSLKILNKIQMHMEQGKLLILKNLESVYPALYDLFNQNFTEVGKKNYARIAIGSSNNAFSLVNDNFRCIVNVDDTQIKNEEPPFLNRFEKHIVSFEYLLPEVYKEASKNIYEILNELIQYDKNTFKGINYDIKKIFISSSLEDIQEIVYNAYKRNIKHQDVIYEVIKKISLILPQDIIALQSCNGFKFKYLDYSNLIIKEYNTEKHNNLRNFIKNMKNTKNIVYTFSNILDFIEKLDDLKNQFLGELPNGSIIDIKISDFKSENQFEKKIDQFFSEEKQKICIIKFKPNEGSFMNYIKFFIENKEKEKFVDKNIKQQKKAFIFIVHLFRINNSDLDNSKEKTDAQQKNINNKKLNETISLLSEYYQIFIDNLNGADDSNLDKIFRLKGAKLYEECLDIKMELQEKIFKSLSYMKYNISSPFGTLTELNYVNELMNFILNDLKLQNSINQSLKKEMENEDNIISRLFKSEFSIQSKDIDMVSIIIRYLSESYTRKLSILYFKVEQDQFFSSLLSINELNKIKPKSVIIEEEEDINKNDNNNVKNIIEKMREIYLRELSVTNDDEEDEEKNKNEKDKKNEIIEKPGMNEINIILGLKLPGIKPIISSFIKKFKNEIARSYKRNENILRDYIPQKMIETKKLAYKDKLKIYNDAMFVELDKNNIISEVAKDEFEKNEFFDLLLEDFYILFIDKNLNKKKENIDNNNNDAENDIKNQLDYNSIKKFLKLITKKRLESNDIFKEDNLIKSTASTINWIESYENDISNILEMFSKLNIIIDNLYDQIEQIINKEQIKYEVSKRSKEYKSIVNKPLFYAMESILKVTSKEKIYIDLINNQEKFWKLININREILQLALKMEANYDLYSKEVYSLQEIILIIDCLHSNNKLTLENVEKIISFFSNETDYINQDEENEIIKSFKKLYETLVKLIGKDKSFNKIMSIIFKNEFIKITKENFRKELLEIIMQKDEFIFNNYQIFKYILYIDNTPEGIINNKNNILEKQSLLFKVINDCKKPYLEETILNIFEYKILNYFNMITEINFDDEPNNKINFDLYYKSKVNNNPNETLILFDLSLKIFKECIDYLDCLENNGFDKEENKNHNLYKLYCISYIKFYISKLVYFIIEKEQYMTDIKDIIKGIEGSNKNNKLRKVIKIYVFKLFYNLTGKNYDNMITSYNFIKKGIEFANILTDNENKYIKEIICENKSPLEQNYRDFPLLKYFIYTEYRTRKNFIDKLGKELKYKNEYPLLYKYLKEEKLNSNVNKLLYLPNFNEFNNNMIEYYSYNISREEAKSIMLNQGQIFSEPGFNTKFKNFLNSWNKIKKMAIKYKDYPKMDIKDLNEEDKLIYFLNDVNEQGYGMYLAAAYQNFINWQNGFLQHIIDNSSNKNYLNSYLENMKKKIPIHESNSNQIIRLINCFDGVYEDFDDLLNNFSRRNIFNANGTINYSKYNIFEYDISSIEEELANFILPGKCLFEDENNYFVTFWGEGFHGGKSNIFKKFNKIYKQTDLEEKEKKKIKEFRKRHQENDFKHFFNSMQLIIFYLINNRDKVNIDDTISNTIKILPKYMKLDKSIEDFFDEEDSKNIKIDKILGIFLYFEHLCFKELCKILQNEYKEEIDNEVKAMIKEKLIDNNNINDEIIKYLGAATRRFISRYLVGKKQKTDIDPKSMLIAQLKRNDLWDNSIENLDNLLNLFSNLIDEIKLNVGQCFKFYDIIKEKDEKETFNGEEDNDDNDNDDDDDKYHNNNRNRQKRLKH